MAIAGAARTLKSTGVLTVEGAAALAARSATSEAPAAAAV